jgi:hypothetical protein
MYALQQHEFLIFAAFPDVSDALSSYCHKHTEDKAAGACTTVTYLSPLPTVGIQCVPTLYVAFVLKQERQEGSWNVFLRMILQEAVSFHATSQWLQKPSL